VFVKASSEYGLGVCGRELAECAYRTRASAAGGG
jgi:hypothetical protein